MIFTGESRNGKGCRINKFRQVTPGRLRAILSSLQLSRSLGLSSMDTIDDWISIWHLCLLPTPAPSEPSFTLILR